MGQLIFQIGLLVVAFSLMFYVNDLGAFLIIAVVAGIYFWMKKTAPERQEKKQQKETAARQQRLADEYAQMDARYANNPLADQIIHRLSAEKCIEAKVYSGSIEYVTITSVTPQKIVFLDYGYKETDAATFARYLWKKVPSLSQCTIESMTRWIGGGRESFASALNSALYDTPSRDEPTEVITGYHIRNKNLHGSILNMYRPATRQIEGWNISRQCWQKAWEPPRDF